MDQSTDTKQYISTRAILGVMFFSLTWMLTVVTWLGRWFTYGHWPSRNKEWIALAISVVFSIFHLIWGRRAVVYDDAPVAQERKSVTRRQAAIIIFAMAAFSALTVWFLNW